MQKHLFFTGFLFASLFFPGAAWAQDVSGLRVVKSTVNAESEKAELCLEFNKTLAQASRARLAAALRLEAEGKNVTPQNIAALGTSLCLFPLERGTAYRLDIASLRGEDNERMDEPYALSFTIPDRSPSLAFTGASGGVNGFGFYDARLDLRAVNVPRAKIEVYRITDSAAQAHAWQDRAQTALAPSESAYLARNKGQMVWQSEAVFDATPNATTAQPLSLRDKMPDLAPGLYLIIADAGNGADKPASKGLAPLAAAWFTKSDFSLRAVRDSDGIHVFTANAGKPGAKTDLRLVAFDKKPDMRGEAQTGNDGIGLIAATPAEAQDIATVIGIDKGGNIAFAAIENLPALSKQPAPGSIHLNDLFVTPGETVDASLTLAPSDSAPTPADAGTLRLLHGTFPYADFAVPPLIQNDAKLSFPAPAAQAAWTLRWQKTDGAVLAEAPLRVTANIEAPHLDITSERDSVNSDGLATVTIKSLTSSGKPAPLIDGQVQVTWQKLDPALFGWKDYRFGTSTAILDMPTHAADFLTDLEGTAALHVLLPKPPQERGLYQATLRATAEPDAGVEDAPPLVLPLHPDATVIGIKPLALDARFTQNSIARFALIGLSSDGKPRDVSGLSYQIYEEGRSFAWYQDEGRWKYKPEAQLRPIGGSPLTIKADGGNVLEWPVTAGNYRLEILDSNGKTLAQTDFSAGWDSTGATATPVAPLNVTLPRILQPGHEATAHVVLPEAAMLTVIIADTRIRKIIHEFRPKGDAVFSFTPDADWPKNISLSIEAIAQEDQPPDASVTRRALVEASLAQSDKIQGDKAVLDPGASGLSVIVDSNPSALTLRKEGSATLTFGIENKGDAEETYTYNFTTSPGLKIDGGGKGSLTIGGKQMKSVPLTLIGDQEGVKDLRLDVTGPHITRFSRAWTLAVLPKAERLVSTETLTVGAKQNVISLSARKDQAAFFVARHSMDGLAEILSFLFRARPFTTSELALSADALRLWGGVLAQAGVAPDFLIAARRQEWLLRLLRHQNADGGFSSLRGGDSTIEDTAAALTTLGADASDQAKPAKNLAIGWLKQRLANTWVDDKERAPRAVAYAALAAADATDSASLRYFSDTSATRILPPIAEADIAAAFKHSRDPNAAAFWIKKMLDENPGPKDADLLGALAATDALSSDEVHAAMRAMTDQLRHNAAPTIKDAAALLRALAADNSDAGKWRLGTGNDTRDISGVLVLRPGDAALSAYRNGGDEPLFVTAAAESAPPSAHEAPVARHIYRMNGVELVPPVKPLRGEIYMIELIGAAPVIAEDEKILVQEGGGNALHPLTCPLSDQMETPAFIPWFNPHHLAAIEACEFSPHALNAVVAATDENDAFSLVYFARIDAPSLADIPPPRLRILK